MHRIMMVALAVAVLAAVPAAVFAADSGDIWMAGFLLLRVRCPAAGLTLEQRVTDIQGRVNDLLGENIDLDTVKVVQRGPDAAIYAGGRLLITVDPCTAAKNRTTPMKLAQVWANRFKELYPQAIPKVPPGKTR